VDGRCVGSREDEKCMLRIWLGNLEWRRPLGRPTHRLEDKIDTDLNFD